MWRGWVAVACLWLATCTPKPPAGYAGTDGNNDSWTFPLVGPLEGGLLFVPVSVNDKGPFLFAIDPDAIVSVIDEEVVKEARLRTDAGHGPKLIDESDTGQVRFFAEVTAYEIGPLVIQGAKPTLVVKAHTFDFAGRRIYGILGHDVLVDSLALTFDRDLGIATLTVQDAFKPPVGATDVHFTLLPNTTLKGVRPVARRIAKATINGETFTVHLDLGGTFNMLRDSLWSKAGFTPEDRKGSVIDEVGSTRDTTQVATTAVDLGSAVNDHALFVSYVDKRWGDADLDGTLGLDFFRPYRVSASWEKHVFYLSPRQDPMVVIKQRLARWSDVGGIAKCPHPGCVTFKLIDPLAGKGPKEDAPPTPKPDPATPPDAPVPPDDKSAPPGDPAKPAHPGVVLSIVRDPVIGGMDFEVVLAATPAPGKPPLPWLIVNIPSNLDRVIGHLPAEWLDATLTVIDASPYPRKCPGGGSCIDKISP